MNETVKKAVVRRAPVLAAAMLGLLALGLVLSGQAQAQPRQGVYVAALATPGGPARQEIVDGQLWKCAGDQCSAPAQGGRPASTCARVARKLGPLAGFTSPQGPLSAEDLARCNAAR